MFIGFVPYVHIKFLLIDRKHLTDGFIWCADCNEVKHINPKTLKRTHYPPSEDEDD